MIDKHGHIRLVDFGLSKLGVTEAASGAMSFVGTTEYPATLHSPCEPQLV